MNERVWGPARRRWAKPINALEKQQTRQGQIPTVLPLETLSLPCLVTRGMATLSMDSPPLKILLSNFRKLLSKNTARKITQ